MTIVNSIDLEVIHLSTGAHTRKSGVPITEQEACVMEVVSWVAGEPWSDRPKCASHVIAIFCRTWNDNTDDEGREALKAFIPRLVGSAASDAVEDRRGWLAADWMVHTYLPLWLRAAGLEDQAVVCEQLPEIVDRTTWMAHCRDAIQEIRSTTRALRADWRQKLRADVKAAVTKALAEKGIKPGTKAAVVAASEVAVASEVAASVVAASVVAASAEVASEVASVEASVAASVEVASEVAVASASVAASVEVASEVAAVEGFEPYSDAWNTVYGAVKAKVRPIFEEKFAGTIASSKASALDLIDRMLAVSEEA